MTNKRYIDKKEFIYTVLSEQNEYNIYPDCLPWLSTDKKNIIVLNKTWPDRLPDYLLTKKNIIVLNKLMLPF